MLNTDLNVLFSLVPLVLKGKLFFIFIHPQFSALCTFSQSLSNSSFVLSFFYLPVVEFPAVRQLVVVPSHFPVFPFTLNITFRGRPYAPLQYIPILFCPVHLFSHLLQTYSLQYIHDYLLLSRSPPGFILFSYSKCPNWCKPSYAPSASPSQLATHCWQFPVVYHHSLVSLNLSSSSSLTFRHSPVMLWLVSNSKILQNLFSLTNFSSVLCRDFLCFNLQLWLCGSVYPSDIRCLPPPTI